MRIAIAALLAASLTPPLVGQGPVIITETEFLEVLNEDHPAFAALGEDLGAARAEAKRVATLENPGLGFVREDPSGPTEQIDVVVAWQPPLPGRRGLAKDSAASRVEAEQAYLTDNRLEVRLELRRIYAEWAVSSARAERLATHAERVEELARREQRRAERGEASGLETGRLTIAAALVKGRLALAEAEAAQNGALARVWRPDLEVATTPALPDLSIQPGEPFADHPEVVALEARLEASQLARKAAGRVVDLPELLAGWQRQEVGDESFSGPILGFAWPVPLAERNQAERLLADAEIKAVEAQLTMARRQVDGERAGSLASYRRLAAAARQAEEATAGIDDLIEAAIASFQHGESSLTDLLETFRSAVNAELAALEVRSAALSAHRNLERAAGRALSPPAQYLFDNGETP
jgi:outer membrane protein TolC